MSTAPVTPRPAATLILVRDADHGLEVLMARRTQLADFAGGAYVFPGGAVDAADHDAALAALCTGLDDAMASQRLGIDRGGLGYWIAAIRESFEEAGMLFAHGPDGELVRIAENEMDRYEALRRAIAQGEATLHDLARERAWGLATDRVHYFSHWITQAGRPRRYDTRFFLAVLPPGQSSRHDAVETTEQVWLAPAEALSGAHTRRLMTPTRAMIELLAGHADTASLLAWARSPRHVPRVLPRLALGADGQQSVLPGHPAWDELGRLDPQGAGTAWSELRPDVALQLSSRVWRLTAAGSPPAHGYLVTAGPGEPCAAIDAAHDAQLEALRRIAPGPIRWQLGTDGRPSDAIHSELHLGDGTTLRLLPGAAGRQWLLVQEQTLFSGSGEPAMLDFAWRAGHHGFLVRGPAAPETR